MYVLKRKMDLKLKVFARQNTTWSGDLRIFKHYLV